MHRFMRKRNPPEAEGGCWGKETMSGSNLEAKREICQQHFFSEFVGQDAEVAQPNYPISWEVSRTGLAAHVQLWGGQSLTPPSPILA